MEVDVWMARLDPAWSQFCAETGPPRATAARGALRFLLGRVIGADPRTIQFREGPRGKPALATDGPHFNASHTANVVAIAIADQPVGIDIEAPRPLHRPARVAARLGVAEDDLWPAWTRTEALLKATGEGMPGGLRDAVPRLTALGWTVRDLAISPLVGAVAACGERWSVRGPHRLSLSDAPAGVVGNFVRDGRLVTIPAARAKRRAVLDFLATQFEPGRTYPESEVNKILGAWHDDYATLRRYLVDEEFLERRDGFYWRAGGTFDVG